MVHATMVHLLSHLLWCHFETFVQGHLSRVGGKKLYKVCKTCEEKGREILFSYSPSKCANLGLGVLKHENALGRKLMLYKLDLQKVGTCCVIP